MRILLLLTALAAVSRAQNDCSRGACYPPSKDLLLGRSHQLHASSTCGLTGSEVFCTPYQQRRMKCCPCDSRNINGPLAHTTQEVLSTSAPDRWWQSKKEVNPVTLQLDLPNLYQLDNLVLSFKGPRPSSFVIERTLDNGRTWQPSLYLATDCRRAFPGIQTQAPVTMDQTYCSTLPPTGADPYKDHTVQFSPLRQFAHVPAPNSHKIESLSGLTGLRVRLTELGDVPSLPGRALSRFYALKEMRVMGTCMCHGHAHRCLPEAYSDPQSNSIQVNPQCDCQHNTAGVNCERCDDLYNDLPWRAAEEENTHTCQRCECHNHAQRCHFEPAVYEASGRRSGGVCEGCMHHTTGPKCDQCEPGYQPNPRSRMDRPDACIRCVCSTEGSLNGGGCDDSTGSCRCKVNVEGPRCDRCKRGHYDLSASNPLGCSKCSCSPDGSLSDVCDSVTGQCPCRPHFHGLTCEVCSRGYWKPEVTGRCQSCACDPTRAYGDSCNELTGQCDCRPGFGGRTCTECPDKTYGNPLIGCQPCRCDVGGTVAEMCDQQTGVCLCRPGVTGPRCDACSRGHCDVFPVCETCPSCFFTLDAQRRELSLAVDRLANTIPTGPDTGDAGKFGPRFRGLEKSLTLIRSSITLPPKSAREIDDVLSRLLKLRGQVDKINVTPLETTPGLDEELDKLQDLFNRLNDKYNDRKDETSGGGGGGVSPNDSKSLNTIKTAYDQSKEAEKDVDTSGNTVDESAEKRKETMDLVNKEQPGNTRDLDKLNKDMANGPNLTPVAKQVCGSVRTKPCTPAQCDGGDLCPPETAPLCKKGEKCVGALPLSKRADADAKDVADQLDKLSGKIKDTTEKLQDTQDKTNQVRESSKKLSDNMAKAKEEMEQDINETRDVVKELKDFLSDPLINPTHIQDVSDWILKAKFPLSQADLKKKLDELKKLGANLPDSTAVLEDAQPQLDKARKLLEEAIDARDKAQGVNADVDGLVAGFDSAHGTLNDLDNRLQDTMDTIDDLDRDLTKVKEELEPAEKALDDVTTLMKPMKPDLDELKELLKEGRKFALQAEDQADDAEVEAITANKELDELKEKLKRLQDEAGTPSGGDGGPVDERLVKLYKDAGNLANTTGTMMDDLEGKADDLRTLKDQIVKKSTVLVGLEERLEHLVKNITGKVNEQNTCQ